LLGGFHSRGIEHNTEALRIVYLLQRRLPEDGEPDNLTALNLYVKPDHGSRLAVLDECECQLSEHRGSPAALDSSGVTDRAGFLGTNVAVAPSLAGRLHRRFGVGCERDLAQFDAPFS
jgi:hypothetical protein